MRNAREIIRIETLLVGYHNEPVLRVLARLRALDPTDTLCGK